MVLTAPTFRSALTGLRATIAQVASKSVPLQLALLNFIHGRITRAATRFERLFRQWQTNTLPKPRPIRPRKTKPREKPTVPDLQTTVWACMTTPPCPLPRARAWLRDRLRSAHANIYVSQLETFLSSPEITQFRAEIPRANRLLNPLCHMLGINLPEVAPQPKTTPTRRVGAGPPRHPLAPLLSSGPTDPDDDPPPILSSA